MISCRVICDRCRRLYEPTSVAQTSNVARRHARAAGWAVRVGVGRDYCPRCRTPNDHSHSWRGQRVRPGTMW